MKMCWPICLARGERVLEAIRAVSTARGDEVNDVLVHEENMPPARGLAIHRGGFGLLAVDRAAFVQVSYAFQFLPDETDALASISAAAWRRLEGMILDRLLVGPTTGYIVLEAGIGVQRPRKVIDEHRLVPDGDLPPSPHRVADGLQEVFNASRRVARLLGSTPRAFRAPSEGRSSKKLDPMFG